MLRKDFVVTAASDGAEGYYKALELPPQLAIVDIKMPGWDGLRTLKAFRGHHLLARVPVMMLTSDASRPTVLAALQGGANDYVVKTTLSREIFIRKVYRQLNLDPDPVPSSDDTLVTECTGETERTASSRALPADRPEELAVANPSSDRPDRFLDDAALESLIDDWD
jgi:DNA-binding response OmpR family regulator